MRQLTRAGQILREQWKDLKCSQPNALVCYCSKCIHLGSPAKQASDPFCWEDEPDAPPPRGRMRDWVQT